MNNRYSRQITLKEIGNKGQKKLLEASVLCIGAGGLGCPSLLYLTAAGVGNIGIVDFDEVDETNLQRQVLFTIDDIGKNKSEAAKTRLQSLNPDINIISYPHELNEKNITDLFCNYDIIIDCTDNFPAKFLINDASIKANKILIYGSILGFDGQVSVFGMDGGPCYRCLFPAPPKTYIQNCAEAGVIGAVAGIIGTSQAMEAIKLIVKHESFSVLTGKLWTIDMHSMETKSFSLEKNPDCSVCSKQTDDIILQYSSPVCGYVKEILPEIIIKNNNALLIDVREYDEWDKSHIDGAVHVPLSLLANGHKPDLPTNRDLVIYCQKGSRGKQAVGILESHGYIDIVNMDGGYERWLSINSTI